MFNFVLGLAVSYAFWLISPLESVKASYFGLSIVLIALLSYCTFALWKKNKEMESKINLDTKVIEMKDDLIILKVNIDNIFTINSMVTVFRRNNIFSEPIAVAFVENIQSNKVIQVRIMRYIGSRNSSDLEIRELVFVRPGINIGFLNGEL